MLQFLVLFSFQKSEYNDDDDTSLLRRPAKEGTQMQFQLRRCILQIFVHVLFGKFHGGVSREKRRVGGQDTLSQLLCEDVSQGRRRDTPFTLLRQKRIHARIENRKFRLQQTVLVGFVLVVRMLKLQHVLGSQTQGRRDRFTKHFLFRTQSAFESIDEGIQTIDAGVFIGRRRRGIGTTVARIVVALVAWSGANGEGCWRFRSSGSSIQGGIAGVASRVVIAGVVARASSLQITFAVLRKGERGIQIVD